MPAKTTTKKTTKASAKVKTSAKKTSAQTAKHSRVAKEDSKPKIRIQKIAGQLSPTNKDLVVDLKSRFKSDNVGKSTSGLSTKAFYSEEEDDSLDLPTTPSRSGNLPELDEDLEYDSDEEAGLSLGMIDDDELDLPSSKPKPVKDYASEDSSRTKTNGALLEDLYQDERRRNPLSLDKTAGGLYKKLAVTFIILVLIVLGVVAYYATVKTTISVSLKDKVVNDEVTINIVNSQDAKDGEIAGLAKEFDVEKSKTFSVEGTEVIGEEVAGKVTIYNKYTKNQPLVATTRLLSASGKLYRLKNSVNVPVGGQVEAEVYADQPAKENVIGAEKLTIPGLWEGMQDKVYAESTEGAITYGQQTKNKITEEQLAKAKEELKAELLDKAKADINNTYTDSDYKLVKLIDETVSSTVDSKIGDEKDKFTITMKGKAEAIAFVSAKAKTIATKKIEANLEKSGGLIGLNDETITYELTKFDTAKQSAEIKMTFAGTVSLSDSSDFIDKKKLVNLNEEQLRLVLAQVPEIENPQIEFFPSFIKKTPSLVDRIEINIVK